MSSKTFKGGIHPPEFKEATEQLAIEDIALPEQLFVPLHQHIGAPCAATVEVGQEVLRGQQIGAAEGFISAPVHSPVTGKVLAVEPRMGFNGQEVMGVAIEVGTASDQARTAYLEPLPQWQKATPEQLRTRAREAGLVGMGGAAFPTSVKLSPPADKPIDVVIINGCECEPFLTCDHRLMLERAEDMITGGLIMMRAVGAERLILGVEDNKPDAVEHLTKAAAEHPEVEVMALHTKYPQGAEKQLIDAALGRVVPARALPMEVGALVHNVGTAIALADAVLEGKPLIERVVTVSGPGMQRPCNVKAAVGTALADLVDHAGGLGSDAVRIVVGGPMTGFAQPDLSSAVVKGTSGLLALDQALAASRDNYYDCVRCQRCVRACPMLLYPNFLATAGELKQWSRADTENALDCVECGACAFECPAKRPMVRFIREAKAAIWAVEQK